MDLRRTTAPAVLALSLPLALALTYGAAQEAAPADPSAALTGETRPREMLAARMILMDTISSNNDFVHDSIDGVFEWNPDEVRARLNAMSSMLLAFPHLYHPATDIWSPEAEAADAAAVTLSLPVVWEEFDAFYALAVAASDTALAAATARDDKGLIALVEDLEGQCESCHATYRRERVSGLEVWFQENE